MTPRELVTALAGERISNAEFLQEYRNMDEDSRAELEQLLGDAVRREPHAASS